jgi:cytochrome c peroxidase
MLFKVQYYKKVLLLFFSITFVSLSANTQEWSAQEVSLINSLSFFQLDQPSDPSNRFLFQKDAIQLGKSLFNETDLSANQQVACATCHIKKRGFTDNKMLAIGQRSGMRNTPTLLYAAHQNWFFWDGSKDSLWAQAISSIENPAEQNFSRTQLLHYIAKNSSYRKQYETLFSHSLPTLKDLQYYPDKAGPNGNLAQLKLWKSLSKSQKQTINKVASNVAKAIASYVTSIETKPTRFDLFAKEISKAGASNKLTASEQQGLKLFKSQKAACINCHSSPIFSNKLFHNIGTGILAKDNGRSEVIDAVVRDPFNCLGKFSDAKPDQCMELKYATTNKHGLAGSFKTPTLRNISTTSPYMHDGRFKNLQEVVAYYASFDTKEKAALVDLPVIKLSKDEQKDLVNFLLTL